MKLSFDWLSDYVDLSGLSPQDVAEKLTMGAFEVEEIKQVGPDIQGDVVVGEILEIKKHPDAEKIRLTSIRVAEGEQPRQIVCGAWNIEVGQRIPVALPGARVINRKDGTPLPIKESKMRGELSSGMLCSAPELGIEGNGEGILILDANAPLGTNVSQLLGIQDSVLVVGTRSNRGDALCVLGLARELAALLERPLKEPKWALPAETADLAPIEVAVNDPEDCPFFSLRVLSNIQIGPSPMWMVRRLEAIGMRSVNNVVDITNYVMQELGQPLHAYDCSNLNGLYLQTRRAAAGEKLITIDERERELTGEILVIADRERPVGIAGIMGGKGSEISDKTTQVALEAAAFNSARIRRSSRLLGLSSDSSLRFERGVDIASVRRASDRAAALMSEYAGARVGKISTAGSDKVGLVNIPFRLAQVKRLCDIDVDAATVNKLLSPLGFSVESSETKGTEAINITVPSFRTKDVTREVDLVEEVVRLYGYNRVPASMPHRTVAPQRPDAVPTIIKQALSAAGLNEAWTSSLVAVSDLSARGFLHDSPYSKHGAVRVLNPLSADHQALRQSLLPGLLKAAAYNQDHGQKNIWLFEVGFTYHRDDSIPSDGKFTTSTKEIQNVCALITGKQELSDWSGTGLKASNCRDATAHEFYWAKGCLENLLQRLSINSANLQFVVDDEIPGALHPSRSARILYTQNPRDKKQPPIALGWVGEVHPAVADAYGLAARASAFELSIDMLRAVQTPRSFQEIFNTPSVVRDLTADVPHSQDQAPLLQCIRQFGGRLLRHVELVSVFDLSEEKKSLSYRLTFQHAEQNLTADQVEEVVKKIRTQLTQQLSAEFRV